LISVKDTGAIPILIPYPTAVLSLDLESDYASGQTEALKNLGILVKFLQDQQVGVTVFVEGTILESHSSVILDLAKFGADLQLHCRNHRVDGGDSPVLLEESVKLFEKLLGRLPTGYRGNTFSINHSLLTAMSQMGFEWDSSVLPARFGFGANRDKCWRQGNCAFLLPKYDMLEFPLATIRYAGIPFIHSYTCLNQMIFFNRFLNIAPLPRLLVYDMHMVDLFRTLGGIKDAAIPTLAKIIYSNIWLAKKKNTLDVLGQLIIMLKKKGYRFTTLTQLHREIRNDR
jgi:peptidoglycan/xylan/chitin deacetylase (PgdA/CDA1 family)